MAAKPSRISIDITEDLPQRQTKSAPTKSSCRPTHVAKITGNSKVASAGKREIKSSEGNCKTSGMTSNGGGKLQVETKSRSTRNPSSGNKSKPSDRLNPKVIDPVEKNGPGGMHSPAVLEEISVPHILTRNRLKSAMKLCDGSFGQFLGVFYKTAGATSKFASLYSSGAVPCRLVHGSVKHKLQWDVSPENLNFDPLLVTLAEGLRETRHPYYFIAKEGFKQLLDVENAEIKTTPIIAKLMPPIRLALVSNSKDVFKSTLQAMVQLSKVVGPALNPHLKSILPALGKQMLNKENKEVVLTTLQQMESNGGKESSAVIKGRIPTYSSVYR